MKKARIVIILIAIPLAMSTWPACRPNAAEEPTAQTAEEAAPSSVTLTAEAVKTAGIETAEAEIRSTARIVHAPGEIMFNPRRTAHVTARASGRIEQLNVYPGDRIRKGQVLLFLYSKDFLSLQAELLQALERSKRGTGEDAERAASLTILDSVRSRLRLLDVTEEELVQIEETGRLKTLLSVRAPLTGNIIESLVNAGDYVEFGVDLFRTADLSTVWVDLHLFEKDLAAVRPGSEAVLSAAAFPGRGFRGRIFQLGSIVDEKTRTIEARIDLANPDGDLRPGMYVEADIRSVDATPALVVPGASLQDYQNKTVVFVLTGERTFAVREVEAGAALEGFVEIRKGLKEKERLASKGSFFLKSELLKKSLSED